MSLGDWTLTVTGEIVRIDRENIDKSGKNPRYVLSFVIAPERHDAPAEAALPSELAIRIKDSELAALAPAEPHVGQVVTMRARANGPRPATFYLTAIETQ